MNTASIVQKIWSYCDIFRDVGISYGDYLEQLTYLLFLKMADEYGKPPFPSYPIAYFTAQQESHHDRPQQKTDQKFPLPNF